MAKAMFGAGCFWGVELVFQQTEGIEETAVGYAGGATENPTYEEVCADQTGHAEVVHVTFDPDKVSYEALLQVFFDNHNPTTHNRQGPDVGSQYRSVIFAFDAAQKAAARAAISALNESGKWPNPVVTEIEDAPTFWVAEDYHQKYLEKRGLNVCHI